MRIQRTLKKSPILTILAAIIMMTVTGSLIISCGSGGPSYVGTWKVQDDNPGWWMVLEMKEDTFTLRQAGKEDMATLYTASRGTLQYHAEEMPPVMDITFTAKWEDANDDGAIQTGEWQPIPQADQETLPIPAAVSPDNKLLSFEGYHWERQ